MKTFSLTVLLTSLLLATLPAQAAITFTHAEVTAQTAGIVGSSWNGSDFQEIATPTAGEFDTAAVIRNVTGAQGSGMGSSDSTIFLDALGVFGSLSQAATANPGVTPIGTNASAATSGGAFAEFTLSEPHFFLVVAAGAIDGPDAPDDKNIGVQVQLDRNGTLVVDYVQLVEGPVAVNETGMLPAGSYSFNAAMTNLFEFDLSGPALYTSSGDLSFSLTLTPVPEPSTCAIVVIGAIVTAGATTTRYRRQ